MNNAANIYTNDFLSAQRQLTDPVADGLIAKVFAGPEQKKLLYQYLGTLQYNRQLQTLPEQYRHEPLFLNADKLPVWAKPQLMKEGTAFFARYANLVMNMLGLLSLPYCYAAADGSRVLYMSERLRTDVERRLQETGQFVWDVMAPDAFEPEGKGFVSILKVRLMHAAARYYAYQSGQWQPGWGAPVNQEDMAGTNLSFSLLVMRGLRKLEIAVNYPKQQAFMHLWNTIGSLLGLSDDLLPPDGKAAILLEQGISRRQFRPSEQGRALTQGLVNYFYSLNAQPPFGSAQTVQLMRFLLSNDVANIIGLPNGEAPRALINLLKISGTLQEWQFLPSVSRAYQKQFAGYHKQQESLKP
jgi:hypothetical protein